MSVSLKKGGKISLSKIAKLKNIAVGLGWDTSLAEGSYECDLDVSAFLINKSGKCGDENDFIFYNNLVGANGAVRHTGDDRTGSDNLTGSEDDEIIKVKLLDLPRPIEKIVFVVTIFKAEQRMQSFGKIRNSFIRVVNDETNEEVLRYNLSDDYSSETSLEIAEISINEKGEWEFSALGKGYNQGLDYFCNKFGIETD